MATREPRPTKRQRQILATLPPDPERPTIDDLIEEEAASLGLHTFPGADHLSAQVMLQVWKRDQPHLDVGPEDAYAFDIATGASPPNVTVEDVRLVVRSRFADEGGNDSDGAAV